MNLSKFSNESDNFKADWNLIRKSVELSVGERNYMHDEISILNLVVIITMNLGNYFEFLGEITPININGSTKIKPCKISINSKEILLIDTYHFSAIMSDNTVFFNPIIDCIKENQKQFNLEI